MNKSTKYPDIPTELEELIDDWLFDPCYDLITVAHDNGYILYDSVLKAIIEEDKQKRDAKELSQLRLYKERVEAGRKNDPLWVIAHHLESIHEDLGKMMRIMENAGGNIYG